MEGIDKKIDNMCRLIIDKLVDVVVCIGDDDFDSKLKQCNVVVGVLIKILNIFDRIDCFEKNVNVSDLGNDDLLQIMSFCENNLH